MDRSPHRIWLVVLAVLASSVLPLAAQETQRSYWQAARGYYSPQDGWEAYKTNRTEMDQPLKYSESEFKRLPISDIDRLAREAKKAHDMYLRYSAAMDKVDLKKLSKAEFWNLSWQDADAAIVAAEDTAHKWPEYKANMARMGREYKTAQAFLSLTAADKTSALAESQGTDRAWHQAVRGYYNATDGWKTYKDCRTAMDVGLQYSEYDFMHLSLSEIDRLAREAKKAFDLYHRYTAAMDKLGLEKEASKVFWNRSDKDEVALVVTAEDTAQKWPEYKANMGRMGVSYKTASEFYALSSEERNAIYLRSSGTSRSTWQAVTLTYSAKDGWTTYSESLGKLGLPLAYREFDFINLNVSEIDKLARHAKASLDLYVRFKALCEQAEKPLLHQPKEIYEQDNLASLEQEYTARNKEWASRIVYANACRRVGVTPNWTAFESKVASEQEDAALLANKIASKWEQYDSICKKLAVSSDKAFLDCDLEEQESLVAKANDELWAQRKEKVGEVVQGAGEFALELGLAYLAGRAGGASSASKAAAKAPRTPKLSVTPKSKIDREAFGKQRESFWKGEAEKAPQKYSADNLKRMKEGKAPMGKDGHPMELHHPGGEPNAAPLPMTRTEHRVGDNYQRNHPWLFEKK